MNTTEVSYNNEITSFHDLFKMAKDQFLDYEKIEGIDDWEAYDFSIDCAEDQAKFKDMLQIRFIEELTEASLSIPEPDEHFWEEIGDSLNFFLSAYIMAFGDLEERFISPKEILRPKLPYGKEKVKSLYDFSVMAYPVIEKVGALCNLLKNRAWAQSNYLVSLQDFNERADELWLSFWKFMRDLWLSPEDVFELFYRKYMVNQFRISTGY